MSLTLEPFDEQLVPPWRASPHRDASPGYRPADMLSDVGAWARSDDGILALPSGRLIRGRGLRRPAPDAEPPEFAVYLLGDPPQASAWEARWVRWPDFRLPSDRNDARAALVEAWDRSAAERVEIACDGGRGRTGTALACLAVLDGVPAAEAVAFVRSRYHPRAVETPWQRRFVARFRAGA